MSDQDNNKCTLLSSRFMLRSLQKEKGVSSQLKRMMTGWQNKASSPSLLNSEAFSAVWGHVSTHLSPYYLQGLWDRNKKCRIISTRMSCCQAARLSLWLADFSSCVGQNLAPASDPNSHLFQHGSLCHGVLDHSQNKYATQPGENVLLCCSRRAAYGPAPALLYTKAH